MKSKPTQSKRHDLGCPAYGNFQPPYEECTCGADEHNEQIHTQQREYNARLIAAAPELLDAIRSLQRAFYVEGTPKAMRAAFPPVLELLKRIEGGA
jgi:hypothetical protein